MRRKWVIAVVVVLLVVAGVGWLARAILTVREAAARSKCNGQLCNLSVILHSYADANHALPPGALPAPGLPPERRLSWVAAVLPYLESGRARQAESAAADDPRNEAVVAQRFPHLVCPSSGEYEWNARRWRSPTPVTHYVGAAGVGADAAELPDGHPRAGVFGYDRKTRLTADAIPDGLGTTLLLVETAHEPGHWAFGGPATVRPFVPGAAPYVGAGSPFGGFHPVEIGWLGPRGGLLEAAFADGSRRTIRDTIDPAVLEALATVNGREALPAEW